MQHYVVHLGVASAPRLVRLAALLGLLLVEASASHAQPAPSTQAAKDPALERLAQVRGFTETAISPDGRRVAWIKMRGGKYTADRAPVIAIAELGSPEPAVRQVTVGEEAGTARGLAWSSDSRRLAFLADAAKSGLVQLHVVPAAGGKARRLTDLKGALADPRWSPDGKQIAFLFVDNPPRGIGPVQPGAVETGEIDEKPYYQRVTVIDLESRQVKPVSPADLYVYEYDWAPDSRRCVLSAAYGTSGDNDWYRAQLYVLAPASGKCEPLVKPGMQIAVPRWSPDGTTIAYIGGLMSDEGATGGDIYTVAASGGTPVNRTPDLPASASWLAWHPSSRQIMFTEHLDGHSGIARLDLDGGVTQLWKGRESITGEGGAFAISASRDQQTIAVIRHAFDQPPEVWAGPIDTCRPLSQANRGVRAEWGKAESITWKSDSERIQGWLLYPRDFDGSRRYPMVVHVHGGPAWLSASRWLGADSVPGALSRRGYFVFFPNPRGSLGQGDRFTRGNVRQIGHADWRDIQAGVDEVLDRVPVDAQRLGITGWSYGGYITMWAVTQTDRYRAAVAGAGIANWQSYYGQNGIEQWMIPYFGASVYDDPTIYARSSPINFIRRVKTPTLILVGERDIECPLPQSQEFYRALKALKVSTRLVVYAGEGHGIANPIHRRDVLERSVDWFDRHLVSPRDP
jgi:dipeptidyl aminopeptidase/acylaminoacyl peptidase